MNVALCYVFPVFNTQVYEPLAWRFCRSYMDFPPGLGEHSIHVYANGAQISEAQRRIFRHLPCEFHWHDNRGKDIGAFQSAADQVPCDLLVCLGSHTHFRQAGWLDRIVQVYEQNGPALYGCWGFHQPTIHIRTTAFWLPPELLKSYPNYITDDARYEFEHGHVGSIVKHVEASGFPNLMVTWKGVYPVADWHHVPNEDCLLLDQHCDRIGYK